MRDRGAALLCLYLFLPFSLFSFDISSAALQTLHENRYWHTLLHYRDGKSEIDSKHFFLSPDGKYNPKAELVATVKKLLEAKEQSIVCRFPARTSWLIDQIPELREEIKHTSCDALEQTIVDYNPNFISLIFPTAHINAPASMYGHTFLRIDSDKDTPLISNAINYAAHTAETNGVLYAYHGLTGGYEGRYSILPYYEKIKEYNDMERRDIWEYQLNLSRKEIIRLLYHYYEIKESYADYYFFTENCSYNLLWLLESARAGTALVDGFGLKAIPVDTIRVLKEHGFIEEVTFRPSKTKKIKEIVKKIEDMNSATAFMQTYDDRYLKGLSDVQKVYILDLSTQMLRYKRAKNKIDKNRYVTELMKLLKMRSLLESDEKYNVKVPKRPLQGHKTSRVKLLAEDKGALLFGIKPSFHDIYDVDKGYAQGAYINFFDLELQKEKEEQITLYKFDLVNIVSYAPRDTLFKPLSWSAAVGWEQNYLDDLVFKLRGGIGYSYVYEALLYYLFLEPAFYYGDKADFAIAPKFGMFYNYHDLKLGFESQRTFYSNGDAVSESAPFLTYNLTKNIALNLKYVITRSKRRDQESGSLALFYYF